MYRVKQLFGGSLTLCDYDGQVAEALAMIRALNKMTKGGMSDSVNQLIQRPMDERRSRVRGKPH